MQYSHISNTLKYDCLKKNIYIYCERRHLSVHLSVSPSVCLSVHEHFYFRITILWVILYQLYNDIAIYLRPRRCKPYVLVHHQPTAVISVKLMIYTKHNMTLMDKTLYINYLSSALKVSRSYENFSRLYEKYSRSYEKLSRSYEKFSRTNEKYSRSYENFSRLYEKFSRSYNKFSR